MPPLRARLHPSCSEHVVRRHSFALSIPERAGISVNRSHSARSFSQLAVWEFAVLETTLSRKADAKRDELLGLVRAGNKVATERFIRLHAPWMLAVARRYLKDQGLAEDCVQESLLSALRNLDKFEQRCEVKTWLHRIVVNFCLMKMRSTLRAQEQPIDHLLPKFDANGGRVETPWSPVATPDEVLEQRQMSALVRAKISELPDGYRIVLLLRDIEELSTQEVAELLGLSGAAVKVRLHRARSALKKLIEPILRGEGSDG
jgi:RNA polymerase sigma-70 factor (ECF subfamily)